MRQCLLSERHGSKSGILFKKINKVIDIVVTDFAAYFMDGKIRGKQHFFGFIKAPADQVLDGRHPVGGGKFPAEAVSAHMEELFAFFLVYGAGILVFEQIMKLGKIAGDIFVAGGAFCIPGKKDGA